MKVLLSYLNASRLEHVRSPDVVAGVWAAFGTTVLAAAAAEMAISGRPECCLLARVVFRSKTARQNDS